MSARRIRILVVDDFQPFRHMILSILGDVPDMEIIGEASDGVEAVRKAQQLQPQLILLDVGLPQLNGIEAARRIRQVAPRSRVLFVSQDNSPEIIEAALGTGAWGFVRKANLGGELLAAVNAVLRGKRFVSRETVQVGEHPPNPRPERRAEPPPRSLTR